MLPMHPPPEQDELLSSWMVRLAFANGYNLHTFYNKVLGYTDSIWNRDTDRRPADDLITLLSRHAGQPEISLRALSLLAYEGILFSHIGSVGNTPWLLPLGVFHRERLHAGMQFCPACLQNDTIIYYRRYWRLAHYVVCHRHGCLMSDHCPVCAKPVAFHRHGVGRQKVRLDDALAHCGACGADLRDARIKEPRRLISGEHDAIGPIQLGNWQRSMSLPCAIPVFQGLHCLISVLMGRNGALLRKAILEYAGLEIIGDGRHEFEMLNLSRRASLMLAVWWLMEKWPARFIRACSASGFTRSRLCESPSALPFWLASVADEFLDRRSFLPCDQEILAACEVLKRRPGRVTARRLAAFMGISIGYASYARQLWEKQSQACKGRIEKTGKIGR